MKLKKKNYFAIHSWIGVQLSMLFFIVCFSGTIAVFSHELDWLFISEIRATQQEALASKNSILEQVKEKHPNGHITLWEKSRESYLCDIIHLEKEDGKITFLFANQYSGELQGEASVTFQRFFRDLHYFLFIPFKVGHFLVLLFGFLLLGSLVSGWKFMRNKKKHLLNVGKKNNALAYNKGLHKTFGLWSIPFVILFSISGIWYFTERANLFSIMDIIDDKEIGIIDTLIKQKESFTYNIDYDKAIEIAESKIPNFTFGSFTIPEDNNTTLEIRGNSKVPLVRYRANRVVIDVHTDKVLFLQKATETHLLKTINNMVDSLHFGHFGGLLTKSIWFIFGLIISFLTASGIWIYLKRISKNKKGTYTFRYVNWGVFAVIQFFMYYRLILEQVASIKNIIIVFLFWAIFIYFMYSVFYKKIRTS